LTKTHFTAVNGFCVQALADFFRRKIDSKRCKNCKKIASNSSLHFLTKSLTLSAQKTFLNINQDADATTLSAMAFSITTLGIMALSIAMKNVTLTTMTLNANE
jgi:hypothetical protein